jgi:hypothetical protein
MERMQWRKQVNILGARCLSYGVPHAFDESQKYDWI